jgi:hypothetical protein
MTVGECLASFFLHCVSRRGLVTDDPYFKKKLLMIRVVLVYAYVGTVTLAAPATAPLVLGLGLGVGGSRSDSSGSDAEATPPPARRPSAAALTFMQRQELEHQVLIYRYFVASAPVPVNLVLPIWKSVAASSSAPQRFPSRTCRPRT